MDLARVQDRPGPGRAAASVVGLCARGHGGALRVVVLTPGAPAPRIQPEGGVPGAGARPEGVEAALLAELPQPRQGLRGPDAAPQRTRRVDAAAARDLAPA